MRDCTSRSSKPPFRLPSGARRGAIIVPPPKTWPNLACPVGAIARGRACGEAAKYPSPFCESHQAPRTAFRDVLELDQAERAGRAA